MEKHKSLYKDQHSEFLPPRQHNRLNRELQKTNRSKQRQERFQDSRNIQSRSPTPQKTEIVVQIGAEGKENENITQENKNEELRIVKIVCNTTNPQKLSKQESYIKRFIEWKVNKKLKDQQQQQEKANKKKPFLTAVSNSRQTSTATTSNSIVPKGHHKEFRPPIGLKMPKEPQKSPIRGRQSIYTIVPTPPSKPKQLDEKSLHKFPIARKAVPTNLHTKIINSSKTPNKTNTNVLKSVTKTKTVNTIKKTPAEVKKPAITKLSSEMPTTTSKLKPKALKMPPPPPPAVNAGNIASKAAPAKLNGAVGKIKNIAAKRAENIRQTKKSPLKSGGARLAQNLKAKKPVTCSKKLSSIPALQLNGNKLLNQFNNHEEIEEMFIQTPKDFATLNPYENFITSTKLRTSGRASDDAGNKHSHESASAKRNIMQHATNEEGKALSNKLENSEIMVKKYNFLINPEDVNTEKGVEKNNNTEEVNLAQEDEKTPTKYGPEERPNNYLSPFVSVNRGKVSLKKETEKRNSMYLQNRAETKNLNSETLNLSESPKNSVEARRTLEAVRYFRRQLQDEIDRLCKLCDVWEEYKKENLEKIQNANGEDMINVAIGQTRLLTSKKFMQFKGLIDRCESGVTGVGAVADDGSENTKPITSIDLEGFWSMLGLQVDNLDKRFETLNRWKLNDWVDPDEVKVKIKKNLAKVKKVKTGPAIKAKPNTALQQMLRKMHAEMRKKKTNNEDIVLTSSNKQRRSDISSNSTPRKSIDDSLTSRRMSIVVKDRKYFSPAATVISVASSHRRTSLQRKSSQDSPKMLKHVQKFNEALDTMETSINLRKSVLLNGNASIGGGNENIESLKCIQSTYNSPVPSERKSILKTPGTARSRMKNVIFNAKLRVKKFNFLVNEDGGDALNSTEGVSNDSHEEDLPKSHEDEPEQEGPQRTLTLRNRKVRLRPSSEIVIPVKQVGL